MISLFKIFLLPLGWLYGCITDIRNILYDMHVFSSFIPPIDTIGVGNLEVGGTGKTPYVEYLIREYRDNKRIAVLSRGYKRKTKGYIEVQTDASYVEVGDEIKQLKIKFPDIPMAVCENRRIGVLMLLQMHPNTQLVILDDAFQHRRLRCQRYDLLTRYDRLYTDDQMLPLGRLRERKWNAKRATNIIVTKCPSVLSNAEKESIIKKLSPKSSQKVLFSTIKYEKFNISGRILLVTGIAHPHSLYNHVRRVCPDAELLPFSDHHPFSHADVELISSKAKNFDCVVTTEKDIVRLQETAIFSKLSIPMISIGIELNFIR